jgi:uncharacterized protein with beta-barrel porin domain
MTQSSAKANARAWKLAVSMLALSLGAGFLTQANAQNTPTGAWDEPSIVPRDGLATGTPPPAGIYDQGITGIGNVITSANPADGGVGVCTGTLINPRTVIFAAHCVNDQAANTYGSAQGGTALSVGFNDINTTAIINWLNNGFATNTSLNIFNANQVWYDPRSLDVCNVSGCFFQADIALATLDTPAFGIPTWTLLFSPLTEATHVTMVGYGNTGSGTNGANIALNFRRRAAENMLDSLASIDDRNLALFGSPPGAFPATVYSMDFDDPLGLNPFDFDIYDGAALPREGMTAGGDSGGPLIVDQRFDRAVVAGVLSGGTRFFGAQPPGSYGTTDFYQPLFLYWDAIVQNNPYVYASAKAGIANWFDPNHWVQDMDPNYAVIRDGALANDLPDTPALGTSTDTTKFGGVCFLDDCLPTEQSGPGENSTGPGLVLPGGPGSTNFVPNNVNPDIITGRRAHYYDVTLDAIGLTFLRNNTATIDRFTMDGGLTALDVRSGGTLNVLGDFTVGRGALNIDGRINSGEALLVQALLTGSGTFNPTFLTSVDGIIAPGGLVSTGTLTVQGDVVLASGNELLIQLGRNSNDLLRVTADAAQGTTGIASLGGDVWFTPAAGAQPRHGQSFTFVRADGAVTETFDGVNGFLGVLRPKVTYTGTTAVVELKAGSFLDIFLHAPELMPFALALDEIRENHYNALYGLYGEIDLMDVGSLSRAFSSLAPSSLLDARGLMAMQDSNFADTLQGRLALIARSEEGPIGLSITGTPNDVFAMGDQGLGIASDLQFGAAFSQSRNVMALPNGMTGFFSGGYEEDRASAVSGRAALTADEGMRSWNMAGGVEQRFGALTLGVAAAYSRGEALQTSTGAQAENALAQSAMYGVYSFDNGAYLSGLIGVGTNTTSTERRFIAGALAYHMQGDTKGQMVVASAEAGVNFDLSDRLTLTPRVGIEQMSARMDGFTEAGGETALAFDDQIYDRLEARAGVSLSGDFSFASGWRFAPTVDASLVANLAGDENGVWARFAAVPDAPFYLPGAVRDEMWGEVAAGFALSRADTSIGFQLQSSIDRDEMYEDRAVARFAQRF